MKISVRRNGLPKIVALLLCSTFVIAEMRRQEKIDNKVVEALERTVEVSALPYYEQYFDEFSTKEVFETDTKASFNGVKQLKQGDLEVFDYVSLEAEENPEDYDLRFNTSYDFDTNLFTLTVYIENEVTGTSEVYETQSEGFVNEQGKLDAIINVDEEQFLISDYITTEAIDNCGLFSKLVSAVKTAVTVVVAVVVTVVVVAETAEQIAARLNHEYNRALELAGRGMNKSNFIYNQEECDKNGYRCGIYKFGIASTYLSESQIKNSNVVGFKNTGCGCAAVYNMLLHFGHGKYLSDVIYMFEKLCVEIGVGCGMLGVDPFEIGRILDAYLAIHINYYIYNDFKAYCNNAKSRGGTNAFIVGSSNSSTIKGGISEGFHNYFIVYKNGKFYGYNDYGRTYAREFDSIESLMAGQGKMLVAYLVTMIQW